MNTKTMSSKIEEKMTELKNYVWYPEYRIKYSEYEENIEYICGGYYMCEGDCDFETFDSIFQWCGGAYHADDNGNPIVEDKDASVTKLSPQEAELVYRNLIIELVVDYVRPAPCEGVAAALAFDEKQGRCEATLAFYTIIKGYCSHQIMEVMQNYDFS